MTKSSGVSKIKRAVQKPEDNRFRFPIPLQLTALLLKRIPPPPQLLHPTKR